MTDLRRRAVLRLALALGASGAGLALLSACSLLPTSRPSRIPRVGFLHPGPADWRPDVKKAFVDGLQDLGYIEGQTIAIEWRFADYADPGRQDAFAELAAELARLPVDVIVTGGTNSIPLAAQQATSTIPIVAPGVAFPVETGLVAGLAHPAAANIAALSVTAPGQTAKQLDLLRDVIPGLQHIGALVNVTTPVFDHVVWDYLSTAAEQAGVQVDRIDIRSQDDLEQAIAKAASSRCDALYCAQNPLLFPVRDRLAELTLQRRLPTMGEVRDYVVSGVLMAYSTNFTATVRRAAVYVDKILKGAHPADLPVEQPTVFDFVVNAGTARALGLTFPPDLAAQVTEWIE